MKNLGIGTKMGILVAVLLATAIVIAIVGTTQLARLTQTFAQIIDVESKAINVCNELRIELLSAIRAEKNAILAQTPEQAAPFASAERDATKRIGELRTQLAELLTRTGEADAASAARAGSISDLDRDLEEFRRNQEEVLKLAVLKTEHLAGEVIFSELRQREQDLLEFVASIAPPGDAATAASGSAQRDSLRHLYQVLFYLAAHLQSQDEKTMASLETEARKEFSLLQESLRRLSASLPESERARGLAAIAGVDGMKPQLAKVFEYSSANTNERARSLSFTRSVEIGGRCNSDLQTLATGLLARLDAAKQSADQSVASSRITVIATTAVGAVISLLLAMAFIRSITRPVARGVTVFEAIAAGDLTRRMDLNQDDEIGRLAKAADDMSGRLQKGVARTRTLANTLDASAIELANVSHDLLSQSQEMSTQAGSVAAATEQMSTNVSSMAAAIEQMSVNIASVSSASEELSVNVGTISSSASTTSRNVAAVADAVARITEALTTVANDARAGSKMGQEARELAVVATKAMHQLNTAADDINKVTDVIKAIALQTNLLAINATIEATSAGEAGRGFAVVAGEIKELASQSGHSAGDIATKIESVQASTAEAVRVIENVAEFIGQLSVAVARISDSVQSQTQTANHVSTDVASARRGVEEIARSIAEVAKGATDVSSNTAQMSQAAADVSRNAAEAASAARSISPNIHGVSEATKQSSQSAARVNESAKRMREISGDLLRNVSHFRTGADADSGGDRTESNG
ncbi:MAG: methyl-accepting chemotaxis protein [Phycisphaerales bacterium]